MSLISQVLSKRKRKKENHPLRRLHFALRGALHQSSGGRGKLMARGPSAERGSHRLLCQSRESRPMLLKNVLGSEGVKPTETAKV